MPLSFPAIDPRDRVREYRANYVNVRRLILTDKDTPGGIALHTPADRPISSLDLPTDLSKAIADYQKSDPDATALTYVKYMKTVNGKPEIVIEDDDPLPAEDLLVTFSHTVTAVSARIVQVVTHQLVATLAPTSKGGGK
jgi:hypothetical protein